MGFARKSERGTQDTVLEWLRLKRVMAWRQNQGGMKVDDPTRKKGYRFFRFAYQDGISDILGLLPRTGRFLAIEMKSETGTPTPDQAAFLEAVNAQGGLGIVARSLDEVIAAVEPHL